jgi:hypothetical protein
MRDPIFVQRLRRYASALLLLCCLTPFAQAQRMLEPAEYLKDPKFQALYVKALGPKAKTPWLAKMDGPTPTTRKVRVIGSEFVLAAFCKNHDCGDNSAVLLYAADRGQLYGTIYEKGKTTLIGDPPPGLAIELGKLWKKEWRQQ